ncbi:organellar elongation factor P [Haematococcus lacustris]
MLTRQMTGLRPSVASAGCVRPAMRPTLPHRQRTCIVVAGGQVSTNDFKNGMNVEVDGVPWKVIEFLHVKPGKGSAFVRSKLKNYLTGGVVDKTFRAGEMLALPDLQKREAQFTYSEGDTYIFMDNENYEETRLKRDDEWAAFLKEGLTCSLLFFNGKVLSVEPPSFIDLEVVECPPGVKGNTASGGGQKPATLETGAVVQVPLFIEAGSKIKIDTRTGTYLSKA